MDRPKVFGNFINGAWAEGAGEYANTNPSDTRDVVGKYTRATAKQANDAIGAAQAAFRPGRSARRSSASMRWMPSARRS